MRIKGLSGLILLAALAAPAQEAQPPANPGLVIRTETKQVLVDAVVTDKKGNYVPSLSEKDFKVWEDTKEQTIRSFSYEAETASPNASQKHYLVLFFDNSTMSFGDQALARQAAGKFVESNTGPNRYMAVVNFSGSIQITQNFTADAGLLKQVVSGAQFAHVNPNAGSTPTDVSSLPSSMDSSAGPSLSSAAEAQFGQLDLLLALRSLAKGLAEVPGRKILVLFTEGFRLDDETRAEVTAVTDTCNKANVAIYPIDVRGLVVMPMGPAPGMGAPHGAVEPSAPHGGILAALAGLAGGYGGVQPIAYFQHGPTSGGGGSPPSSGGGGSSPGGSPTRGGGGTPGGTGGSPTKGGGGTPAPTRGSGGTPTNGGMQNIYNTPPRIIVPQPPPSANDNQQLMYMLADGTGGFVIVNTNDLLGGLEKIGKEQNQYYLIGYTPPDTAEGSCHVIKVKVEKGYTVRARSGYCNVRQVDLLAGKQVERDLETRASANVAGTIESAAMQTPFFYLSPNAARLDLALEIPTGAIQFAKVKGHHHAEINILGIAYNPSGAVGARFSDTVKLDFADKKEMEAFLQRPFLHYDTQFDMASGSYDLKVLFSSGGAEFGKLEKNPLVIDPYDGKGLFISGVALSTSYHPASRVDTDLDAELLDGRAPLVASGTEITPGGTNRFKKTDKAVCYLEIYEPALGAAAGASPDAAQPAAAPAGVSVEVRLLDAKTGDQKSDSGAMDVARFVKPGNPTIPVALRLPIDGLAPGTYLAEFKAADMTHRTVARKIPFEVVE